MQKIFGKSSLYRGGEAILKRLTGGYALPTAFALGLCMISMGVTSVLLAQDGRDSASLRRDSAASVLVSDSAIAEVLASFSLRRNSILLGKNFDLINPETGRTYLGPDGIPNSGDEGNAPVDEWTGFSPNCATSIGLQAADVPLTQTIGAQSSYRVLAYRYNPVEQKGDLLVEGIHLGVSSYIHVSMDVSPAATNFPGVLAEGRAYWQGRALSGTYANLYFDSGQAAVSGLNEQATPDATDRDDYLNAIWGGDVDGITSDDVDGNLVACSVNLTQYYPVSGQDLGPVTSGQTLSGQSGQITYYQVDSIELTGADEIVIDTTDGPVVLLANGPVVLRDTSKIRNVRTDGVNPQVGDVRIVQLRHDNDAAPIALFDASCIETAFIYSPDLDVQILSTADGCPGESNSSVIGVIWAEDIINSKNSPTARDFNDGGDDFKVVTANVSSGIEIPEDLSSLTDILEQVNLPIFYSIHAINSWSKVGL